MLCKNIEGVAFRAELVLYAFYQLFFPGYALIQIKFHNMWEVSVIFLGSLV